MADDRLTLVYDGDCDFCTRLARWVERHDDRGQVSARPNQEPGLIDALGLTRAEVDRAAWAIDRGGRFEGAAAVSRVLRELGGGWRLLGSLYLLPPIGWLENRYYRRVARKRSWW